MRIVQGRSLSRWSSASVSEFLLFASVLVLPLNVLLYSSSLIAEEAKNILRIIALALIILSYALSAASASISAGELLTVGACLLLFLLGRTGAINVALIVMLGSASRLMGARTFLRAIGCSTAFTVLIHLLMLITGVITSSRLLGTYANGAVRIRDDLGFYNPNVASILYVGLLFLLVGSDKKRSKLLGLTVAVVVLGTCYLTGTRSVPLALAVFLLSWAGALLAGALGLERQYSLFLAAICLTIPLLSIYIASASGSDLDLFLSYRSSLFSKAIAELSDWRTLLLGSSMPGLEVDNSYLCYVASCGLLVSGFMLWKVCRAVVFLARRDMAYATSFILACLFFGLVEGTFFRPESPLCLAFWCVVFCCDSR